MTVPAGRHTLVVGAALQQDRFDSRDLPRFDYIVHRAGGFAQDQIALGRGSRSRPAPRRRAQRIRHAREPARLGAAQAVPRSGRRACRSAAGHSRRPVHRGDRRQRLSRLAPLIGLEAERARTGSADVTWTRGPFEISATLFGSNVDDAVQLATLAQIAVIGAPDYPVGLVNAPEPVRTWGTEFLSLPARPARADGDARLHAGDRARRRHGLRREVPLTPRHAASLNAAWEAGGPGRRRGVLHRPPDARRRSVSRRQPPLRALRRPRRAAHRPRPPVPQRREPRRRPPDEGRAAGAAAAPRPTAAGRWTRGRRSTAAPGTAASASGSESTAGDRRLGDGAVSPAGPAAPCATKLRGPNGFCRNASCSFRSPRRRMASSE